MEEMIVIVPQEPIAFVKEFREAIEFYNSEKVKCFAFNSLALNSEIFWDIALELSLQISEEICEKNFTFFETCQECLYYLAENGNAKELFLILLEQADCYRDDTKFEVLLRTIKRTLLRLDPAKRAKFLCIALATLTSHLNSLDAPENQEIEGAEKKNFELDPAVDRIGDVMQSFLNFIRPFIVEIPFQDHGSVCNFTIMERNEVIRVLFGMLHQPLVFVNLSHNDETGFIRKTNCRESAEGVISFLGHLHGDFFKLLTDIQERNQKIEVHQRTKRRPEDVIADDDNDDNDNGDDLADNDEDLNCAEPISELSIACFLYLVLGEQLSIKSKWPCAFKHEYILEICMPYILALIKRQEYTVIYKGLYLAEDLLQKLRADSLSSDYLDCSLYLDFVEKLVFIMTRCQASELRNLAVKLGSSFIRKFQGDGRKKLYRLIMKNGSFMASVRAHIIGMIKDEVIDNFKTNTHSDIFSGQFLFEILSLALKPKTLDSGLQDVLEEFNKIIGGLNLLRFLVIKDPQDKNVTGIWHKISALESLYLEPLKTTIQSSIDEYKSMMTHVSLNADNKEKFDVNILGIDGGSFPRLSTEEQINLIKAAISSLELTESVRDRVTELIALNRT